MMPIPYADTASLRGACATTTDIDSIKPSPRGDPRLMSG